MAEKAIERKYLGHFLNATPGGQTATYVRLGKDLEEYNTEFNQTVEKKKNIIGETSVKVYDMMAQATVEPFYATEEDPLFEWLQDLIDNRKELDDVKTDLVEVHLWDGTSPTFTAYKEEVYIEISSYGGNTSGYQIPFNIHHTGTRTAGTFNVSTKAFTPTV